MNNLVSSNNNVPTVKGLLANVSYKKRFEEILGKKAAGFMSSIINLTNSDTNLSKCDPNSVIASSVVAATLDLPIDRNLGFAWILPYGKRAQFQMGWKGYVQLALRTGQYKAINVLEIYKGQLKSWNPLTEELQLDFDSEENEEVIGFAAYFKLVNGFEKTVYWSKEKVLEHAMRFSKTWNEKEKRFASYNKWKKEWIPSPWETDFNAMAEKTVLKNTLSKWGILSIEMQVAIQADQGVIKNEVADGAEINSSTIEYADNPENQSAQDVEYTETEETHTKLDEKFKTSGEESKNQENIYEGTPLEVEGDKQ